MSNAKTFCKYSRRTPLRSGRKDPRPGAWRGQTMTPPQEKVFKLESVTMKRLAELGI